jgi:23S rRNA pseudouridine2605 synthase
LIATHHHRTMIAMPKPGQAAVPDASSATPGDRIAKVIARSGLCSRRAAEALILEGRVTLNGKALATPAVTVTQRDVVRVDGKELAAPDPPRLWRYHKPSGLVTTNRDPQGRPTIFERLPADLPRVMTIGRLDITTEGLLLLTNDGALARALELPKTGWLRRYRVRVHGQVDQARLDQLSRGITIDGVRFRGIDARLEREQGSNAWISMSLREGQNREIKTVLAALGLQVTRLIRTNYGPFALGQLERGQVSEIARKVLREQLPEPFRSQLKPLELPHAHRRR